MLAIKSGDSKYNFWLVKNNLTHRRAKNDDKTLQVRRKMSVSR